MKLYLFVIIGFTAAWTVLNHFVFMPIYGFPVWLNIVGMIGSVIAVIAIDGILAAISHSQRNKLNPFSKYFTVSKEEKNRLIKLGVRRYKDLLPDLGTLVKFPKRTLADPKSKEYIHTYIIESCCGEIGHILGIFLGFLIVFILPLKYFLVFGIPVAAVNAILCLLPVLALRYNRYSLMVVYRKLERDEKNKQGS